MVIDFDETGRGVALWSDALAGLAAQARVERTRASHVLPVCPFLGLLFLVLRWACGDEGRVAAWTRSWPVRWFADLSPVGGPRLGPFFPRSAAIQAEQAWLRENL